jgi:beta-N-acetylhexosaminidase
MAAAFAAGLREQGICPTFKHFPGHGDTAQDSHSGLAVSYKTREELEICEWIPFREATSGDLVMTAHVALPEITGDMTPATLSREIVTGILREELGFAGLIITDAMNMGAIVETYGSAEAAVAALRAGCDIILMPENLPEAFDAVIAALEDGRLTEEWLDDTVRRILEFKQTHGILN